ncbi:MAG: HAD-IA family hydrolase [Anaerolineae bacterium]|nr:HAD-IA family hydrolase [Anaerolineae bacterium]NIQ78817.1 HAD-IA family hydrolase [Anaerolineae bacterium]
MIRAMIFDLDGTLVQTERLKALSYGLAVLDLCPDEITEAMVIDAFTDVVGLSRRDVATSLVERFGLEDAAEAHMAEFGVNTPWQALVQLRLRYYSEMMSDPAVLRNYQWPHNVALLQQARDTGCKTGLATMSACAETRAIVEALDLVEAFDFVATRDDVDCGKPDPEIYDLVSRELDVPPAECLVIEDSPSGVKAALAAQMWCIVVTTPMTRKTIHTQQLLDERWVVDEPAKLTAVAAQMLKERKGD